MMYSLKRLTTIIAVVAIFSTFVTTSTAFAQPPPPEDPSEPWFPPDENGGMVGEEPPVVMSEGSTPPPPGAQAAILSGYMQDQLGNSKLEFIGNEQIYLNMTLSTVPGNRTTLHIAEYFPTGTLTQHWLIYNWPVRSSGTWRFGPFYAQPLEPEGTHTWKIWLTDLTTRYQDHYLVRFNYFAEPPPEEPEEEPVPEEIEVPEEPMPPADIVTSINITLSTMKPVVDETVTVFTVVNPANAGNVAVEHSTDGVTWIPIGSGSATGTVISQFIPSDPGSSYIRAKVTEFVDTNANKRYLASESSPVILEVTGKGVNTLALGLGIGLGSLAGVLVWFLRRRRATTSS